MITHIPVCSLGVTAAASEPYRFRPRPRIDHSSNVVWLIEPAWCESHFHKTWRFLWWTLCFLNTVATHIWFVSYRRGCLIVSKALLSPTESQESFPITHWQRCVALMCVLALLWYHTPFFLYASASLYLLGICAFAEVQHLPFVAMWGPRPYLAHTQKKGQSYCQTYILNLYRTVFILILN